MNTWVFGDVHGNVEKLRQCLSKINLQKGDTIIGLGDYVDRGVCSYEVVELLLSLEKDYNCIWLRGNHDQCFLQGFDKGDFTLWNQGCRETVQSYRRNLKLGETDNTTLTISQLPETHFEFFDNLKYYYIDKENRLFVHAGINRHHSIEDLDYNADDVCLWDRDFINSARSYYESDLGKFKTKDDFKEIFVGHTPTQCFGEDKPMQFERIYLLDTGCGKGGELTIMNVETKQYYQSK